ncbi:MAG: hypothetical protein JST84_07880 [Acidobacteria bacterium]|nr:hypothetical protein [Acidobacteriota bacterium]
MKFLSSMCLCLFLLFVSLPVVTQAQSSSLDQLREKEMLNAKLREEDEKNRKAVEKSLESAGKDPRTATPASNAGRYRAEKDLPNAEKKLLATDLQINQTFASVLRQPETGLFKLLNFKDTKVAILDVKAQSAYPQISGGGTFYSFTKRHHLADEWAQIRLKDGILQPAYSEMKRTTIVSSGGVAQSFVFTSGYELAVIAELGNLPLEAATAQHPVIKRLSQISPPTQYQDFIQQIKQYETGVEADGVRYHSSVPARPNATYALRCVTYKKADILLAFQIVHNDAEGNLHILWKQIAQFPAPELKGKPKGN